MQKINAGEPRGEEIKMANSKKKSGAGRVVAIVLGVLFAIIAILGAAWGTGYALTGEANPAKWAAAQNKPDDGENKDSATGEKYVDGMVTTVSSASKMRLASRAMTAAASAKTDSQYMLTATVEPADADEQTLTWSVAFKNPASAWANGKIATDYVTVTPTSDTKNARVNCLAAFGEQIIVTTKSVDNPDAYATCTCDYVMRAQNLVFEFGSGGFDNISYTYSAEGTAHTIESELQISSMTMKMTNSIMSEGGEFRSSIANKAMPLFIAEWGEYEGINRTNTISGHEVNLLINQAAKTVSIPGGKGSSFLSVENYSDEDYSVYWTDAEKVRAGELIDQAFRQAVKSYTGGYHAVVKVSYQMTYKGENYGEGTLTTHFNFNYQTIKVGVNGVSLDMSGIVF